MDDLDAASLALEGDAEAGDLEHRVARNRVRRARGKAARLGR